MKNYIIVQKPPMMVIGIECRTSNNPDAGPRDIPQHWEKFYKENIISQIPSKISNEVIALYSDYEGDYTQPYSFVLGCQTTFLDEIPEGLVAKILPVSSYAVFVAAGDYPKSLIEVWGEIWQTNLERTYSGDYEIYGEKFVSGSLKEVDIFIAVQPNFAKIEENSSKK